MTNSSSLFTPRFSSGLQDLHFLNRKCLIHPTCLSWSLLSLSPPFFFFHLLSVIFTFHTHTHCRLWPHAHGHSPSMRTYKHRQITQITPSPLGSLLAVPSPVSQSSQRWILLIQTAVTAASALGGLHHSDTTQSHADIMLRGDVCICV